MIIMQEFSQLPVMEGWEEAQMIVWEANTEITLGSERQNLQVGGKIDWRWLEKLKKNRRTQGTPSNDDPHPK